MIWIAAFFITWLFGIQDRKNQHVKVNRIIGSIRICNEKILEAMVLNRDEVVYTQTNRLPGKSINTRSVDPPCISQWFSIKKFMGVRIREQSAQEKLTLYFTK